jgi:diguanylate cyclase (GGDEF)-like protein
MTDNSGAGQSAGTKRRKQRRQKPNVAADTFAQPNDRTEAARVELAGLNQNLADVQHGSTSERATELREANEQLILAALHAETRAEIAVTHLDELAHSSQHDALTGTPNRALMLDRVENAIAFAKRHGTRIGVLFLDLDEFKQINDTLGHAAGDAVVQLVARRLESEVRQSDTISRHGGDEFLVLLAEISQPSDAALVAEKILAALAAPSRLGNHPISLSASIGIALFPDDGTDAATLIASADTAMYSCKRHGGRNFQFYGDAIARTHSLPSPPRETRDESSSTEQPSATRRLREANEQLVLSALTAQKLEEQIRHKHTRQAKVMARVAHELRNVVTQVETASELLNRAYTEGLTDDAQDVLRRQAAHMSRLVEDLLVSACAGTGTFRVAMSSVDIVDVLTRTIEASRPAMAAKHQQLTIRLPPGPLVIQADAVRLAQIFCDLLDNASKYTPDGGEISLAGELAEDAVVVTVSDNGIGMSPARLGSIFEPFVHDECRSAVGGGLGIGLAAVHELIEAHGGAVVARSRGENLGSEFSVTLPIPR